MSRDDALRAYREAVTLAERADLAFQAELQRAYGRSAGDRRYQRERHADAAVEATKVAFQAASERLHQAGEALRAAR